MRRIIIGALLILLAAAVGAVWGWGGAWDTGGGGGGATGAAAITSGTIDGATIGGVTPAAGTFTNLTANGTVNLTGATVSNGGSVTTVDINGGTVDGANVGATTPGTGQFSTLGAGIARTDGTLHVHTASAGAVVPNGGYDDLVVENDAAGGITIATPDAQQASLGFASPSNVIGALVAWQYAISTGYIGTNTASGKLVFYDQILNEVMRLDGAGRLQMNGNVIWDDTPGADHAARGQIVSTLTVDSGASGTIIKLMHIDTDGELVEADADGVATMPGYCITIEAGTGANIDCLEEGYIRDDSWNWTVGGIVYASTTAGGLTQTAPSGANDVVQVVGVATHADRMKFDPEFNMTVIAP